MAAAGFTGIGFTIDDLEAAQATYGLAEVKRICDDLGLVHLEVELLENWWTTGADVGNRTEKRRSLLHAAEVLGARQIKIGPDVGSSMASSRPWPTSPTGRPSCTSWPSRPPRSEPEWRWNRCRSPTSPTSGWPRSSSRAADHPAAGLVVDIWHLERGPSTLADLAEIPGDKVFVVELNDAPAPQSSDLFHDTIHHRLLCGTGTFDVRGFVETLQQIGFTGPWGVEIISDDTPPTALARRAGRRATARRW